MFIDLIVGARPNFIKISGIITEIKAHNKHSKKENKISYRLIHTGQHYSKSLSKAFFSELNPPIFHNVEVSIRINPPAAPAIL